MRATYALARTTGPGTTSQTAVGAPRGHALVGADLRAFEIAFAAVRFARVAWRQLEQTQAEQQSKGDEHGPTPQAGRTLRSNSHRVATPAFFLTLAACILTVRGEIDRASPMSW